MRKSTDFLDVYIYAVFSMHFPVQCKLEMHSG